MQNLLTWLSKRRFPYEPLITVELSRSRLLHNLDVFAGLAKPAAIAPVLKSNAYGHGLLEIAHILEDASRQSSGPRIPFFVVDSYFEAIALRARHVRTPLLVIGYTRPETILTSRLRDTAFTVTNTETLEAIAREAKHAINIHLKIDTGMHRQGISLDEIDRAMTTIEGAPLLKLEGIASHLSDADNENSNFTLVQIHDWNEVARGFRSRFPSLRYIHLAATDGHRYADKIEGNVTRLGIGLYGLANSETFTSALNLKPVMEMKTIISGIKKIETGATVGYGNTFKADRDILVATIPVGYYEGVERRQSNAGTILVGTRRVPCPIVGRVSMNITTIDVTAVSGVKIGDPVVVVSNDPRDPNSITSMAKKFGEITYEIAVRIPAHLKRVIVA